MFEILVTSSVLIVGLLCLRKLAKGKISMRFRYALWLLVAIRLLFPVSFGTSPLSVLNFFSGDILENGQALLTDEGKLPVENEELGKNAKDDSGLFFVETPQENTVPAAWNLTQKAEEPVSKEEVFGEEAEIGLPAQEGQNMFKGGFSLPIAAGLLWLFGFLAVGGYMLVSQIRFVSGLVNNRQVFPEDALSGEWRKRLSRRGIRERITSLTGQGRPKRAVFAVVLAAVFLICGCAFTGADQDGAKLAGEAGGQMEGAEPAGTDKSGQTGQDAPSGEQERQKPIEVKNEEIERIHAEYVENLEQLEAAKQAAEQEAERAAFQEVLNYHGVMEGRDDSELELNRKLDIQAYYDYVSAADSEAVENPMENGWYLLFHNESEAVSLYGLYTEEFGFRGIKMKTMVGGNVNTWDIKWCPSYLNQEKDNIRVLERESNGLASSIVLKILEEETSDVEIWRLYSGFQYDTGTIDMKMLEPEEYLAWANRHLSFEVDQEAEQIVVTYDGDETVGTLDISAYKDYEVEDVQINTDTIGFELDGKVHEEEFYDGYEGVVIKLAVGLKLKGSDEIWIDGLTPLTVQVVVDGNGNFKLQQPTTTPEPCVIRNLNQERRLADLAKR